MTRGGERRWARRDMRLFGYKPWYPSRNASLPRPKAYDRLVRQWVDSTRPLVDQKHADRLRPEHKAAKGQVRRRDRPDAEGGAGERKRKRRQRRKRAHAGTKGGKRAEQ